MTKNKSQNESPVQRDDSKDDSDRKELLWEDREEKYVRSIENDCRANSVLLDLTARKKRACFRLWSVPSMLLPLFAASWNEMAPSDVQWFSSLLMLISGVCTVINTFFNFGRKSQQFFDYSNKFRELADEISVELCKPKRYRMDCDLVLHTVSMKRNSIASTCPS